MAQRGGGTRAGCTLAPLWAAPGAPPAFRRGQAVLTRTDAAQTRRVAAAAPWTARGAPGSLVCMLRLFQRQMCGRCVAELSAALATAATTSLAYASPSRRAALLAAVSAARSASRRSLSSRRTRLLPALSAARSASRRWMSSRRTRLIAALSAARSASPFAVLPTDSTPRCCVSPTLKEALVLLTALTASAAQLGHHGSA